MKTTQTACKGYSAYTYYLKCLYKIHIFFPLQTLHSCSLLELRVRFHCKTSSVGLHVIKCQTRQLRHYLQQASPSLGATVCTVGRFSEASLINASNQQQAARQARLSLPSKPSRKPGRGGECVCFPFEFGVRIT